MFNFYFVLGMKYLRHHLNFQPEEDLKTGRNVVFLIYTYFLAYGLFNLFN